MRQDELRKKLKIAKIENPDLFNYEDIADMINVKTGSLYNWLSGSYNLSYDKEKILKDWLNCFDD